MKEETPEKHRENADLDRFDGPLAAPAHHRLVYEDERVRIVEFRVPPGDFVPVHTHRYATLNYVVAHSDFVSYDADGRPKFDSRTGPSAIREGEVFRLAPYPPLHAVENVGDSELHGLSVEFKD